VLVSATNGKTTTAAMTASILARQGVPIVHNQAGANMAGGIASTLLDAADVRGQIDAELGLFEVDEFWLEEIAQQLRPRTILLGNLFRDQLDRYGELESIAARWDQAVHNGPASDAQLVLNADDPMIADLGRERSQAVYFGVQDDSLALAGMAHAADAKHCRRCGAPYVFDVIYMGHLGHYHCPSCGQTRPTPTVSATRVSLEGVRSAHFTLATPAGTAEVALPLPGLYNVYNALAAAALSTALGVPLPDIVAGLESTKAAFGRAESVKLAQRELRILLIKNPAGANEVLRALKLEAEHPCPAPTPPASSQKGPDSGKKCELDLWVALNDRIADGRDVSWVWDADFEVLTGAVRRVTCAGTRAPEMALRLKYAGWPEDRIVVEPDIATSLDAAVSAAEGRLFALPTYTALLELRKLLADRGLAKEFWQ
jgi:lipid II isoglutaminyl synthase (glutamine-hydrolysing)